MRTIYTFAIVLLVSGSVCLVNPGLISQAQKSETPMPKFQSQDSELSGLLKSLAMDESSEVQRCERALNKVMSFDVKEIALNDFVEHLRQSSSANFLFDEAALKAANIEVTDHVSVNLKDVKLSVALRTVLDPRGLTYMLKNGIILITDKESAAQTLETRIYPIADIGVALVDNSYQDLSLELIDIILFTVDPDTWDDNGGDGRIEPFLPALCLVITQSQATHAKIEDFLNTIRLTRKRADSILKQVGEKSLRETYSDAKRNQIRQLKLEAEKKRQENRDKQKSATKQEPTQNTSADASNARLQQAITEANEARRVANEALQAAKRLQEEIDRVRASPPNANRN